MGLAAALHAFLEEGWAFREVRAVKGEVLCSLTKDFPHMDSTQAAVAYVHARGASAETIRSSSAVDLVGCETYGHLILQFDYRSEGRNVTESVMGVLNLDVLSADDVHRASKRCVSDAQRLISGCFGAKVAHIRLKERTAGKP